jgi:hypothetical protein
MTVLEEYDRGLQEEAWVLCENKGVGWECVNSARGRDRLLTALVTKFLIYIFENNKSYVQNEAHFRRVR